MTLSSNWLGQHPLKVSTRVQVPLGSPIQTAAGKRAAVFLFSQTLSEFECLFFENGVLGSFYELIYAKVFVFQYVEYVEISLGRRGYLGRLLSPHSQSAKSIGIRDLPFSVKLYSTLGGSSGYTLRLISPSRSNSFKVVLSILKDILPISLCKAL